MSLEYRSTGADLDRFSTGDTLGASTRLSEEFLASRTERPRRPDPFDRTDPRDTTDRGDRGAVRPERPDGLADRGRTVLDGKPISIAAERDANGDLLRIQYKNKDGAEILSMTKGPDGKLHVDMEKLRTSPEGQKLLQKMGIDVSKLPADGAIPGKLELQHGRMKYVDKPDNPTRKTTFLREDGSRTEIDGKTYVRTDTTAAGASTQRGWDGRGWRELKSPPKVTTDAATGRSQTTLEFKDATGKNKSITRVAEDKDGGMNKTTFTKSDGRVLEYDWKDRSRKDTKTGKTEVYDGLGKYVTADKVQRTLGRDGSVEYKTGDTTVTRDKDNKVRSIESGNPKKKLELDYDQYGDVKSFKLDGKKYTRENNDQARGLAYHMNRTDTGAEDAFKRLTKHNTWKVEPGGEKVKFNLGVTENGKLLVGREGRQVKELKPQDLAKLTNELTGRPEDTPRRDTPDRNLEAARRVRREIEANPRDLNSAREKLMDSAGKNEKAVDAMKKLSPQEQHTLFNYLEARKRDVDSLSKSTAPATAEAGMLAMKSVARGDKFAALTPAQAQKMQDALLAAGYRPRTVRGAPRR